MADQATPQQLMQDAQKADAALVAADKWKGVKEFLLKCAEEVATEAIEKFVPPGLDQVALSAEQVALHYIAVKVHLAQ